MRSSRIVAVLVVIAGVLGSAPAASADRPFAQRFARNVPGGDITIAANTLMTCPAAAANCLAARAGAASGAALSNNAYAMSYVDVDADPATFSSSRAQLNLPPGAEVIFAGLYFGGRTSAGGGGVAAANASARAQVKLAVPGASSYQSLAGAADDSVAVTTAYQGFVDVTAQVAAAGPGLYTVADAQAGTGLDRYSGWALVVAYRDDAQPPRNLTVFDGLQSVAQGDPSLTVPVSGFETPQTGPVRTRAGFVVYEGDRGGSGDRALLNGRVLADAANPANNFFNSTISIDGVAVTSKDPDYVNQLGFDAILTNADGYLANGDTAATIELSTTLDQYLPGVVTFATELDPAFFADLVVENPPPDGGAPAKLGEELHYAIGLTNNGAEPISEVELVDTNDAPVSIVDVRPGDAECDRRGSRSVECEIGGLAPGEAETVKVILRPLETGKLMNTAMVTVGGTEVSGAVSTTRVRRGRAHVELTKSVRRTRLTVGDAARFEIVARTRGKLAAVDLRVCDRLPEGLSVLRARGATVSGDRACWRLKQLAPGKRRSYALTARAEPVPDDDAVTNVATAEASNLPKRKARAGLMVSPETAPQETTTQCRTRAPGARRC